MRAISLSSKSFWLLVPFVVVGWVLGAAGAGGAAFVVVAVGLVLCPFANLVDFEPRTTSRRRRPPPIRAPINPKEYLVANADFDAATAACKATLKNFQDVPGNGQGGAGSYRGRSG